MNQQQISAFKQVKKSNNNATIKRTVNDSYENALRLNNFLQISKQFFNQLAKGRRHVNSGNQAKCLLLKQKAQNSLEQVRSDLLGLRCTQDFERQFHPLYLLHMANSTIALINNSELKQAINLIQKVIKQQREHKYNLLFISRSLLFKAIIVQKMNSNSFQKQSSRTIILKALRKIKKADSKFLNTVFHVENHKALQILVQIMIIQFHFAVISLIQLKYLEGTLIYKMNVKISQKFLGPYHTLTRLIKQIHKKRVSFIRDFEDCQKQIVTSQYQNNNKLIKQRLKSCSAMPVCIYLGNQNKRAISSQYQTTKECGFRSRTLNKKNLKNRSVQQINIVSNGQKLSVRGVKGCLAQQNNQTRNIINKKRNIIQTDRKFSKRTFQDVILQRNSKAQSNSNKKAVLFKNKVNQSSLRQNKLQVDRLESIMHDFQTCNKQHEQFTIKEVRQNIALSQCLQQEKQKKQNLGQNKLITENSSNCQQRQQNGKNVKQQVSQNQISQQLSSSSSEQRIYTNKQKLGSSQCILF